MSKNLTFAGFSTINRLRCQAQDGFNHSLDSWHPTQWTNAIAGECGEACNITKKILRHDQGIRGNIKAEDQQREDLVQRAMKELADVIIYADLAIQALGGDTEDVLKAVFNGKSSEIGSDLLV